MAKQKLLGHLHQRRRPLKGQLQLQVVCPHQNRPHHAQVPQNQLPHLERQPREFQVHQQQAVHHVLLQLPPRERAAVGHERVQNQRRQLPREAQQKHHRKQLKQQRNKLVKNKPGDEHKKKEKGCRNLAPVFRKNRTDRTTVPKILSVLCENNPGPID